MEDDRGIMVRCALHLDSLYITNCPRAYDTSWQRTQTVIHLIVWGVRRTNDKFCRANPIRRQSLQPGYDTLQTSRHHLDLVRLRMKHVQRRHMVHQQRRREKYTP